MLSKIRAAACILITCFATFSSAQKNSTVKVMTQNMDSGTDLGFAFYGLQQPDPRPFIDLTLAEVDASGIPERAAFLAAEIASNAPQIVSLQEVTLWRTGATIETATTVRYDQLELLMTALSELGAPYRIVAVNTLSDTALPTTGAGPGALRVTDRDVLLARSDLSPSEFQLSDVGVHVYAAALTVGPFTIRRGFISALARVNNQVFRIANTHLENKLPGVEASAVIQRLQASELVSFMGNSPKPVILCGDYNSDAISGINGGGPDNTDTVSFIEDAGYADSWAAANSINSGATWPLWIEDQNPPNFFVNQTPWERIDLIFSQKLQVLSSIQVGAGLGFGNSASDHTGVISQFQFAR